MKLRGLLAASGSAVVLLVSDLVQRLIIVPLVHLMPSRRDAVLHRWQRLVARTLLLQVRFLGGANFGDVPEIEARPGTLVLMNHQSFFDILVVILGVRGNFPRIVTRARYSSGIPLISHMVRLYQYPTVDPRATVRGHLHTLGRIGAGAETPLVVYPEGTRSRDGSLGRFRTGALRSLFAERRWTVYLWVIDGFWKCGQFSDFVDEVPDIEGRHALAGPFESPGPEDDFAAWVEDVHGRMREMLEGLREGEKVGTG